MTAPLADTLDVSPQALTVPDIDSCIGLMHTLFTLEDKYGLHIDKAYGEVCLKVDVHKNKDTTQLTKCCVLRDRQLPCLKPVRSRRKKMTVGVTAIPHLTKPSVG